MSTDIPAAIRRAVIERNQHCRFPGGTTTAWNKDKTKILHSHSRNHSPPARPG